MLSLALAIIMVSSLSSGVILAKGDDDHDSRKKNKNKYHTERDVGIMTCADEGTGLPGFGPMFVSFDSNVDDIVLPVGTSCSMNLAVLLDNGYKIEDVRSSFFMMTDTHFSSYTLLRKRKVKNED